MEGPVFTIYLCRFRSHVITIMNCNKHNDHLLLELLEQTLIWCSQNIMNLGNLVQLVGSREERIQAETQVLLTQQSHSHRFHFTFVYAGGGKTGGRITQKAENAKKGKGNALVQGMKFN